MREVSLREFISMWDVTNEKVFLTKTEPVRMLDELGEHLLVRVKFEKALEMLPKAFIDHFENTAILFIGSGDNEEMVMLSPKEWIMNKRRRYVYFEIQQVWDENHWDCNWYIVSPLRLTKPRE